MSFDPLVETPITFTEATGLLPRRRKGKKPSVATLYRWSIAGCRGVRLEFVQIGGTRCTSREALSRFFAALTAAVQVSTVTPPSPRELRGRRLREVEAAERELGIKGL